MTNLSFHMVASREDIQRVTRVLAERFRPQKIILFGSQATGKARPDSDVDLLIVLPFTESHCTMMISMLGAIRPSCGYELIPRTPEEVETRYAAGDAFIRNAIDQGIVLYEAAA